MSVAEVFADDWVDAPPAEPGVSYVVGGDVIVSVETVSSLLIEGTLDLDMLHWRERDLVLQLAEINRRRADAAVNLVVESCTRVGGWGQDGHASVRGWVKALCNWSNQQAKVSVSIVKLIDNHALVRAEYVAGRVGLAQMVELARLANHPRAGKHFANSEALLVEDAQKLSFDDFKIVCGRWLTLADPDGIDRDEQVKHQLRNGCCVTDADWDGSSRGAVR